VRHIFTGKVPKSASDCSRAAEFGFRRESSPSKLLTAGPRRKKAGPS
jgi:hypothetical protein